MELLRRHVVQSARLVAEHQNPVAELAICGVDKTDETGRLCRMDLAVHGLEGDIRHGGNVNSYQKQDAGLSALAG